MKSTLLLIALPLFMAGCATGNDSGNSTTVTKQQAASADDYVIGSNIPRKQRPQTSNDNSGSTQPTATK